MRLKAERISRKRLGPAISCGQGRARATSAHTVQGPRNGPQSVDLFAGPHQAMPAAPPPPVPSSRWRACAARRRRRGTLRAARDAPVTAPRRCREAASARRPAGGRVRARVRCGRSRPRAGAVWVVVPAMGSMVKVRVVARSNAGRSPNRKPSPATCCARRGPAQLPGARSRGCRFGSVRNFENRNRNVSWTCTSRNSPGSVGSLRREGRGRARMLASLTSPWALPHACMLRSASPTSRRICGTCERDAACPISTG